MDRSDVRQVTVILAGSRTGSSFLFKALRSTSELIAPVGEETPYYRQAGIGIGPPPGCHDAIYNDSPEVLNAAASLLLADVGLLADNPDLTQLKAASLRRLALQWPGVITEKNRASLEEGLTRTLQQASPAALQSGEFYLAWIRQLHSQGFAVDPGLFSPQGDHPRNPPLIEEPPYVLPEPLTPPTSSDWATHSLLLKTSSNTYRVPFLRALFPRAQFRWILLSRNPAAAIGALMDGWISTGFHSHDLHPHTKLQIRGYSDVIPGGDRYWKFDLPPGWLEFTHATLPEVCAFQWRSAYEAIERLERETSDPTLRVRYEDLLTPAGLERELTRIRDFAQLRTRAPSSWRAEHPVTAVTAPAPGKWRKWGAHILPLLQSRQHRGLLDLAARLSYAPDQMEEWA